MNVVCEFDRRNTMEENLPIWIQDILKKGKMLTIDFFMIMKTLAWKYEGDNEE